MTDDDAATLRQPVQRQQHRTGDAHGTVITVALSGAGVVRRLAVAGRWRGRRHRIDRR